MLATGPSAQQFVLSDVSLMREWCHVTFVEGLRGGGLRRLISGVRKADFVLCWFGCRTTATAVAFARMLQKPVVVIAGGQDVADVPEIKHGMMNRPVHKQFIKYAFTHCDAAVAVSKFTAMELLRVATPKALCLIYNGVQSPSAVDSREPRSGVLCVARVAESTVRLKGIDVLLNACSLIPEMPVLIVGEVSTNVGRRLLPSAPNNVRFLGRLDHNALIKLYNCVRVYVQPSYYESFGVALVEAMAAGCVPVVTNRGALPEVVGDTGFQVEYGDANALSEAIKAAYHSPLGVRAHERASRLFGRDRRREQLRCLCEGLVYGRAVPKHMLLEVLVR